jgi:hypothetical protein
MIASRTRLVNQRGQVPNPSNSALLSFCLLCLLLDSYVQLMQHFVTCIITASMARFRASVLLASFV